MNGMNVSSGAVDETDTPRTTAEAPTPADPGSPEAVLDRLAAAQGDMPPQLRRAATFLLENAAAISVSSMRQLADAAGVKPNTLVRMARALGFEGFEDFRRPFQERYAAGAVRAIPTAPAGCRIFPTGVSWTACSATWPQPQ